MAVSKQKPDGLNALENLLARVAELERCKHDSHNISSEAIDQLAEMVIARIIARLAPVPSLPQPAAEAQPEED